jgi:L-asparaginase II
VVLPLPALLEVRRGDVIESRHRGSLVLLDESGPVLMCGTVDEPMLPRSSLKPFQATAMLEAGFPGTDPQVALASSSHDGAALHRDGVRAVLAAAGLNERALRCPPDLPLGAEARAEWLGAGHGPAAICHNCSGKHAAMVATCAGAGWDVPGYLAPEHPVQRAARASVERLCGEPVTATTVDGCGAPAFATSLTGLARGFGRLATAGAGTAEARVADAMRTYPDLVGGSGRPVTDLMAAVPGLVAKDGAEGVWGAALPDGRAVAAKIEDGASRALGPLLAAVVTYWGFDVQAVAWSSVTLLGGDAPVGAIEWSPELRKLLAL